MTILITGVAGFIGSHLACKMLSQNFNVLGIDNLNNYYSVNLKKYRLKQLNKFKNFTFIKADLSKAINLEKVIKKTIMQPHTRPSRPSIKLTKFMVATAKMIVTKTIK